MFFPSHNPIASLIGAYGGFAIGFAVRPIGGAVLGHIGDRVGRQTVLIALGRADGRGDDRDRLPADLSPRSASGRRSCCC